MNDCSHLLVHLPPLAPSVEKVLCTLHAQQPLTGQQIRERTDLPRRTVYAALKRLKEVGVLHERTSLRDTRQTYFWLELVPVTGHAQEIEAEA